MESDPSDEEAAMLPRRGGVVSPAQRVSAKARGCRRPRRLQLWVLTSCAACCSVVLFIAFVVALPSSALHAAARGWHGNDPAAYYAALNPQLHRLSTASGAGSLCVIRAANGVLDADWDPRLYGGGTCEKDDFLMAAHRRCRHRASASSQCSTSSRFRTASPPPPSARVCISPSSLKS